MSFLSLHDMFFTLITSNLQVLKEATERGVILLNITQCMHGAVDNVYETGEVCAVSFFSYIVQYTMYFLC